MIRAFILLSLAVAVHADSTRVLVNQQINGGQWNLLGEYSFYAGNGGSVTIRNDGTSGYVIADAVMFIHGADTLIVDDADSGRALITGAWTPGGGTPGYYGVNYLHDGNELKGQKAVCFVPLLPDSGLYRVCLRWTEGGNRAANAPVDILYNLEPGERFTLSVVNGSGSGEYATGERIALSADPAPSGKLFNRWIADSRYLVRGYAHAAATTLMPAHSLTITADYRDSLAPAKSHFIENMEMGFPQKLVYLGTSITASNVYSNPVDSALSTRFPGLFSAVNSGVSGTCSRDCWHNVRYLALDPKPDAVIIEFNINDDASQLALSLDSARIYADMIIDSILAYGQDRQVMLMTMHPCPAPNRDSVEYYYQMYREVAAQRGLLLIDNYPDWKTMFDNDRSLFNILIPDGIHPTDEGGRRIIAPNILETLDPEYGWSSTQSYARPPAQALRVFPNPFNPVVTFMFPGAKFRVFDLSGRLVTILSSGTGQNNASWNASGRPSGVYLVEAQKGDLCLTKRIVLSR
jgi:acyl-CoA thioesterase I